MRVVPPSALAALASVVLLGCSSIPEGGDPGSDAGVRALAAAGRPALGRLAVAPVTTLALAADEAAKGWQPVETPALDPREVRRALIRGLEASGSWDRVRPAEAPALADAWSERDDLLLEVTVTEVRTRFDGHNGWWIPNVVNFVMNLPLAWWVATEEYALTLEAEVRIVSVDSGQVVASRAVPVEVKGTFDDFDRGWQFFGPITSTLDAPGWRGIAARLFPEARRVLGVRVAVAADAALRALAGSPGLEAARRKTLVLAVGVERYADARAFPPLPFAASDARAVAAAFARLGALPQHVVVLADEAATAAAVSSAVADHLGRAREDDTVVVYFAGYGARGEGDAPALVLHDAGPSTGRWPLVELGRALARHPGRKLLLVDAGFGGRGRSISGPAPARASPFEDEGLTAILAGGTLDAVLAPDHLGAGLATHRALRWLLRPDGASSGRIEARELFAAVQARVRADAELLGVRQIPEGTGLARVFLLPARGAPRGSP